jgi:hypothetical protein
MTDYTLTDEQKKRLTLFLGECWHEITNAVPKQRLGHGYCPKCDTCFAGQGMHMAFYNPNAFFRTFTTPQDAHDLAKKLVEVGKWFAFDCYAVEKWLHVRDPNKNQFTAWLFAEPESPARFCYLVNAYLEEK